MTPILLTCTVVLGLAQAPAESPPRKPHPIAPSLPQLTREEEAKIEDVINRFIKFDIGELPGPDGQKAKEEFAALGPEAFFQLVAALQRAASIEASCPAVSIGRKILTILRHTKDPGLLDFARENIGAGVTRSPHMGVIKDLRMVALMRRRDVGQGNGLASLGGKSDEGKIVIRPKTAEQKALLTMPVGDLAKLAGTAKGDRLKDVLLELEKRPDAAAIDALVGAMNAEGDSALRYLAQEQLQKNLARQPADKLRAWFADPRVEVRTAAAWAAAEKKLPLGADLIVLLDDKNLDVGQAARQALNRLAGGDVDFGPNRNATDAERADAMRQWREWLAKQGG